MNRSLILPPGVVWRPLPGSQVLAMSCPAQEVLYEGTRGPGKTDVQLMRFRRKVGMGYGRFWRGIIMDREYKNLEDLIGKSLRHFKAFNDGAKFLSGTSDLRWVWPTGEELLFRVLKRDEDYFNYHGHEYPFQGWNELTKYQHNRLYDAMLSTNRSSFVPEIHSPRDEEGRIRLLPPIPLEVFSTTNPYGPGHGWVKREWIDPAPPGVPVFRTTSVFNPRTQQREDVVRSRVRIFGSYKENPYLDAQYIATLENITEEAKRRAWLWGDWDIVAGGAFADLWGGHLVLPRFKVPASWRVSRSFDWGSSAPFSVGWNAEASGEEAILPDGSTFCPPPRSIIRIAEWYGSKDGSYGLNEGLHMSAKKMAEGILEREAAMKDNGWVPGKIHPGPADNAIWNEIRLADEDKVDSIARTMEEAGVEWERSIKSPGSRIQGLQLWRDRMENAADGEGPGWWCMDNCRTAIACLPVLQRDPKNLDDVDTESEDHLFDEGRYAILAADAGATDLSKLKVY